LPAHEVLVLDEAHEALDIFATVLGTSVGAGTFRTAVGAASPFLKDDRDLAREVAELAERLNVALNEQYDAGETTGLGETVTTLVAEGVRHFTRMSELLRAEAKSGEDPYRRQSALGIVVHLVNDLARLQKVTAAELLWLTRRDRDVEIELSLVDVGPRLREELWGQVTGVLTSATIPETLADDIGLGDTGDEIRVPSPFDYANHALLYVPQHLPDRKEEAAEAAIAQELIELITAAGGRTLALFTNRAVMKRVADVVKLQLDTPVLVQDTLSRRRLIERFRDEQAASLFAVTSYWQGVDVPGHSLSLVTIDRLPFSRPDDPLSQARRERAGDRAFNIVDLPRAAMLLAQGTGRLIRSSSDRGVVAVLDTRLATANYRGRLLKRLPPMKRTRDKDEVVAFLSAINQESAPLER
jgi:ATP-dependent DNA helicase DinG